MPNNNKFDQIATHRRLRYVSLILSDARDHTTRSTILVNFMDLGLVTELHLIHEVPFNMRVIVSTGINYNIPVTKSSMKTAKCIGSLKTKLNSSLPGGLRS